MEQYEIAIVGCGPSGMSAALNAKIRNKEFVILGSQDCAEKLKRSPQIDNYLGCPEISGRDLMDRFSAHLAQMSIKIDSAKVTNIYAEQDGYSLVSGDRFLKSKSLIICTGVSPTNLIPGEEELLGKGVGYCATCDGPLYKGKKVAIIAYNREAEEEANYLAGICQEVIYVPQYREVGSLDPRVSIKKGKPQRIVGETAVSQVELDQERFPVNGVFILRETLPAQQLLQGLALNEGSIIVDREMSTNLPGVFAAGDCTGKPYQLAKAVGEGSMAALSAAKYLDGLNRV